MREFASGNGPEPFSIAFVTIGSQEKADTFCARFDPDARCIGDPDMRTYRAMGLGDFDLSTLQTNEALVRRRAENEVAGFRQDWDATVLADAAQLPGAAVIDAGGLLRFVYRGAHPGDLPPVADLIAEARRVLGTTT